MISTIICTNKYTNTITNILEYEKDFLDISSTSILYIYETTGEQIEMSKSNIAEIYMYLVPFSIFLITIKLHIFSVILVSLLNSIVYIAIIFFIMFH